MKRSEMVEIMAGAFRWSRENFDLSKGGRAADLQQMELVLRAIEAHGMFPPMTKLVEKCDCAHVDENTIVWEAE